MTNKVVLRTVEEFMADYQPVYKPLYAAFLGKSKAWSEVVGQLTFKRLDTVGDIRLKHVTPKDSELMQINAAHKSKVFKKYFVAGQFVQSLLQDTDGNEDVIKQVLDENQKLQDDLFLLGEGTSGSDVINNGLFYSGDANYVLENSASISNNSDNHLSGMHAAIMTNKIKADLVAGQKLVILYGSTLIPKALSLYPTSSKPFKEALQASLGAGYSIIEMPADVTPAGANGWIIANIDQVQLHYTTLPKLSAQGVDEREMESWHNFMAGSMMLEVLVSGAVIRQPCSFA